SGEVSLPPLLAPHTHSTELQLAYIFTYNLFQFCGHTWILANMMARFLTFGRDALADTFYSVGVVMSLCQLLSILELFHIADGIEKARPLPRLVQVIERNLLLVMVIMLEDVQSKPVVCVQFFLWNVLDLLRYALLSTTQGISLLRGSTENLSEHGSLKGAFP
uniref:Very-long-chain (3R)-3-hydroxyacyl-CoA dehydratase n=1 Tax=Myripristis murdjan TaxID=586833 RepID=A0A667XYE5_9TELE